MLYVCRMITKREIYFSDPKGYNDPFDCQIANYLEKHLIPFGVLCFSTDGCDMVLMFSHYANGHKGLCLQFQIDEDDTLSEIAPLNGREIEYSAEFPKLKDDPNVAHMSYLIKHERWAYEREYRVVMPVYSQGERIRNYKHGQLCGAIFGLHMSPEEESMVRHWFHEGGHESVSFKKAMRLENDFELRFVNV